MEIVIELVATRGAEGFKATIDITSPGVTPVTRAVAQTFNQATPVLVAQPASIPAPVAVVAQEQVVRPFPKFNIPGSRVEPGVQQAVVVPVKSEPEQVITEEPVQAEPPFETEDEAVTEEPAVVPVTQEEEVPKVKPKSLFAALKRPANS